MSSRLDGESLQKGFPVVPGTEGRNSNPTNNKPHQKELIKQQTSDKRDKDEN